MGRELEEDELVWAALVYMVLQIRRDVIVVKCLLLVLLVPGAALRTRLPAAFIHRWLRDRRCSDGIHMHRVLVLQDYSRGGREGGFGGGGGVGGGRGPAVGEVYGHWVGLHNGRPRACFAALFREALILLLLEQLPRTRTLPFLRVRLGLTVLPLFLLGAASRGVDIRQGCGLVHAPNELLLLVLIGFLLLAPQNTCVSFASAE
mmetsp:Transcript_22076/g.37911  ORF Transcript_22076/g.37911 Transcript_22076/m.37911 type:complete len:204 (-) Transcript_22076:497-1108(-)